MRTFVKYLALAPFCLASAAPAQVATAPVAEPAPAAQPALVVALPEAPASHPGAIVVPQKTMLRLMVLNEVNTHRAKPGDTFVLRVDEPVTVGGAVIVPVGAKAMGEVTRVEENKALGKPGKLAARLLHLELGESKIPLSGEEDSKGNKGGDRVAMAVVGFGVFGLLARGSQGKFKAGHIINGYFASDMLYDPATASFILAQAEAATAGQ